MCSAIFEINQTAEHDSPILEILIAETVSIHDRRIILSILNDKGLKFEQGFPVCCPFEVG